jgi:hypothetical protein
MVKQFVNFQVGFLILSLPIIEIFTSRFLQKIFGKTKALKENNYILKL